MLCFVSDEEEEDADALLYLPVAPDIDEPEEGWPIVSENVSLSRAPGIGSGDEEV